jgi:hypothetical protein
VRDVILLDARHSDLANLRVPAVAGELSRLTSDETARRKRPLFVVRNGTEDRGCLRVCYTDGAKPDRS